MIRILMDCDVENYYSQQTGRKFQIPYGFHVHSPDVKGHKITVMFTSEKPAIHFRGE
ncbi:MAG: hypothetical protein ACLFVQ_11295 [Chitinispirillaceae bacterium]